MFGVLTNCVFLQVLFWGCISVCLFSGVINSVDCVPSEEEDCLIIIIFSRVVTSMIIVHTSYDVVACHVYTCCLE